MAALAPAELCFTRTVTRFEHPHDARGKTGAHFAFADVAVRANFSGHTAQRALLVRGKEYEWHSAQLLVAFEQRGHAVARQEGHVDVHQHQIRPVSGSEVRRVVTLTVNEHAQTVAFEQAPRGLQHQHVIVDDHDRFRSIHFATSFECDSGRCTVNSLPTPTSLRTSLRPPSSATKFFTIARPRPVPEWRLVFVACNCPNFRNRFGRSSAPIPSPVSRTRIVSSEPAPCASSVTLPRSVNLTALLNRLVSTRRSSTGSVTICGGSS